MGRVRMKREARRVRAMRRAQSEGPAQQAPKSPFQRMLDKAAAGIRASARKAPMVLPASVGKRRPEVPPLLAHIERIEARCQRWIDAAKSGPSWGSRGRRPAGPWAGSDILGALATGKSAWPPGFEGSPIAEATQEERIQQLVHWILPVVVSAKAGSAPDARLLAMLEARAQGTSAEERELRIAIAGARVMGEADHQDRIVAAAETLPRSVVFLRDLSGRMRLGLGPKR